MAVTINGNSLVFTNCTITLTNFSQPLANGVASLIITPAGGVGQLPALVQGTPGLPALFSVGTVTTLSAGSAATVGLVQTSAGGPGLNSTYNVNFGIPQGAAGTSGSTTIGSATDLSGTAAVNDIIYVSGTGPTAFSYAPMPFVTAFNPSTFSPVSQSGQASATLCTVSIPAQTSDYIPFCFASCTTVGTANTIINLTATLTSNNDVLGQDLGLAGVATQKLKLLPSFGGLLSGGYATVLSGAQSITLVAQQTAAVSDAWSIATNTMSFTVGLLPVAF